MRIDEGVKREILARVDIASFIGAYVPLRNRGNDLVGLCPFHGEKTPSFHVHPDKGFFKCFGCQAGGDVFNFVMKLENVPFPEAVRILAARAGVEITPEDPRAARARSEREEIYEANHVATAFFERVLRSEQGAAARTYCERRGFTPATLERFHLGYAPNDWNALTDELRRSGVDLALAERAGLVKAGQRGHYDFYRDRLMVPTYATTGEVIAFGGRSLGDAEPKYLNTSTTPVYTKGRHLFGLNIARRAAAGEQTLIVVEGYLDCIALHQAGFENAVASLGTSFTEDQARELRKYAENVFLCFDGDAAGAGAATKAIEIATRVLEHSGTSVRIVRLPAGDDPDSYVRAHGRDGFKTLLDSAISAIEFRLEAEVERLQSGFASPARIVAKAEQVIQQMTPRAEWDRWRVWIAKRLKVNENDLRNSRFLANTQSFAPRNGAGTMSASRHVSAGIQPTSFEREVLAIVLEDPTLVREFRDRIPATRFRNEMHRRIYSTIVEHAGELNDTADIFALFAEDTDSVAELSALGQRDRSSTVRYVDPSERRVHLERVVERLQLEDERRRYQELSRKIDELLTTGQTISSELRSEYDSLVSKLKK